MGRARWIVTTMLGVVLLCAVGAAEEPTLVESGVALVPPRDATCPAITLAFGAAPPHAAHVRDGRHDGIDITLPEGTPLHAIAAGKVIALGPGPRSAGHYVWLQHTPTDTGLPFWVYSAYRHVDLVPDLEVGGAVKVGAVIATAGKPQYPSFHFATMVSASDQYDARGATVTVVGAKLVDPAVVYVSGLGGLPDVELLRKSWPNVLLPYTTGDGETTPARSRVIWPVACRRR